jgi:hypothetical protein
MTPYVQNEVKGCWVFIIIIYSNVSGPKSSDDWEIKRVKFGLPNDRVKTGEL